MQTKVAYLFFLLAGLTVSVPAFAQEGHPLTGTWYGDWGTAGQRNPITLVLSWDGENVTGVLLNPGPDTTPVEATLDSRNWTVRIEADEMDASGRVVQHVADGRLEDVGSHNRTISGTWSSGGTRNDFQITRD